MSNLTIRTKRVYDEPERGDGLRILVDRLWPRGIAKKDLHADVWAKELAPSTELRKWFAHDPDRWAEFGKRYRAELKRSPAADAIDALLRERHGKVITLLYAAKDREHNNAVVLRRLFENAAHR